LVRLEEHPAKINICATLGPSPLLILALGSPGFAELPQQFMLPRRGGLGFLEGAPDRPEKRSIWG